MTRLDEIENKWRDSTGEIDTSDVNWLIAHCRILEAHLTLHKFARMEDMAEAEKHMASCDDPECPKCHDFKTGNVPDEK